MKFKEANVGGNGHDKDDCYEKEDEVPVDTSESGKNPTETDKDTVGWEDPAEKQN